MSSYSFIKTLKRIGYPDADSLDSAEIDSMMSNKNLKPFFEAFCCLTRDNVLTTEEIMEYSALTPAELAEIEMFEKSGQFQKDIEQKKEADFLQEKAACIKSQNKSLRRRLDLFKKHEEDLLQEKDFQQKLLIDVKEKFEMYEMVKVPQAEEEFVSNLMSSLKEIQDLESLIMVSEGCENKLPSSMLFQQIVEQYLEAEKKILLTVTEFMQTNLQLDKNGFPPIVNSENLSTKDFKDEAFYLQKRLKDNMIASVLNEKEACKTENMMKCYENVKTSVMNNNPTQKRLQLHNALIHNEKLKRKEEELIANINEKTSKYVDTLVAKAVFTFTNDILTHLQTCDEKMLVPMNALYRQRARVEMVIASLLGHKEDLQNLKQLVQNLYTQIQEEKFLLQKRKAQIEKNISKKPDEQLPQAAVFSTLYKILDHSKDLEVRDLSKLSMTDLANKLLEADGSVKRKYQENLETIEEMENRAASLESLLTDSDKEHSPWQELKRALNTDLYQVISKLESVKRSLLDCGDNLEQKEKLLERNEYLRLSRNLYVYALTNMELFKKCIQDVKVSAQNVRDKSE